MTSPGLCRFGLALALAGICLGLGTAEAHEEDEGRPIRLLTQMSLSPDGQVLVFAWRGDLWWVRTRGGKARRLTFHPARDATPRVSPDGERVGFVSNRSGSNQVWIVPLAGGEPTRITAHTEGFGLEDWSPLDGTLLVRARLDHAWRRAERLLWCPLADGAQGLELVFDDYADDARISPDGRHVAFTREGVAWWRKGYRGSQASQVWLYDRRAKTFEKLTDGDHGERWPLWDADGRHLYVTSQEDGTFNLWRVDLETRERRQLTRFVNDGVLFPTISADGSTVVFRHLFDLWSYRPDDDAGPERIEIRDRSDPTSEPSLRRTLTKAADVAFTDDAREIAFVAGGDVWVMDTELREPRQVTDTPEEERDPLFSPDFQVLYFVSDVGGQPDIWTAKRQNAKTHWWQNETFVLEKLTDDPDMEEWLSFTPDGKRLAFIKGLGDLVTVRPDGTKPIRLVSSWHPTAYDFSPDGQWVAYAREDENFNGDVWIRPADGKGEPYNVSRHPDDDGSPAWSPDGRILAFTGERWREERDICYVWLRKADEEEETRDRKLEKALEKMKGRKAKKKGKNKPKKKPADPAPATGRWTGRVAGDPPVPPEGLALVLEITRNEDGTLGGSMEIPDVLSGSLDALVVEAATIRFEMNTPLGRLQGEGTLAGGRLEGTWSILGFGGGTFALERSPPPADAANAEAGKEGEKADEEKNEKKPDPVEIDFDGLADRIHRISIPDTSEWGLMWSPDSKRLAFRATVNGSRGLHAVTFPDDLKPKRITSTMGESGRWLKEGNQIAWLAGGVPATMSGSGKARTFSFRVNQALDRAALHGAAFDQAWRVMRDTFYDPRLNNRDWDDVRTKYRPLAASSGAPEDLEQVVRMMLGELNGSHLGFSADRKSWSRAGWSEVTGHLGARFDADYSGPGRRVKDVIRNTPAWEEAHRLGKGDLVLAVDGSPATPENWDRLLTLPPQREVELKVRRSDGREETLRMRPTTYARVRVRLYDEWLRASRAEVDRRSRDAAGYLHVRSMNWSSFDRFEAELYKVGHGKKGLIVDVRDNGGGFTTDHLLTVLMQPRHARTVSRGGRPGYPEDRLIYARWSKPVVVLCNQNSFSNAEIFAHAIKTLGRGQVVGVPTAGGVLSTGGTTIMGVGRLRLPFRGWFVLPTGEDMERAGCIPHHIVWPEPGDAARGRDRQLEKGVVVLLEEIEKAERVAWPAPRYASERD